MRILLIVIFSALCAQLYGQQIVDRDVSFYSGTWEYNNIEAKESLIIVLKKKTVESPWGTLNCLYGAYRHSKDGVIITDRLADLNNQINDEDVPIYAYGTYNQRDTSYIFLRIFDYKHGNRLRNCRLHFVSAEPPRIQLELVENDELYAGETLGLPGFSLPNFVTLTKKE